MESVCTPVSMSTSNTARTCKHLHKLAAHGAEEGDARLSCNGAGQVRLARARGTLEDDALQPQRKIKMASHILDLIDVG